MRNYFKNIKIAGLVLLGASLFLPVKGNAFHKYHSSLTRIDYNAKEKLFEITIQLFTHDLVPLMKERAPGISENDPVYDRVLLEYLNENFELRSGSQAAGSLQWVGKETKVDIVYVYVEIPVDGGTEELSLKNTIFFDQFAEQKNLVSMHFGEKRTDLFFKNGDKFKTFDFTAVK